MRDKIRKRTQTALNKKIKWVNDGIKNDNLWRGRFVAHQISAEWERFEDNSGGTLYAIIRVYDKETDIYHDYFVEYGFWNDFFINWDLYQGMMNRFIVNEIKVWDEEISPYKNKKDWNKIKVSNEVWRRPKNGFIRSIQ